MKFLKTTNISEQLDSDNDDLVSLFEEEWLQNVTPPLQQTNEETGEIVFAEQFNFDFSGIGKNSFLKSRN